MGEPIPAYFGKNTYAQLRECSKCHKRYDESGDFVTMYSNLYEDSTTVWWLLCRDCAKELEESDD